MEEFFSSQAMLLVVVALVALAAFALGWLLLGTAARVKADRDMAARMAAIGRRCRRRRVAVDKPGTGWIPRASRRSASGSRRRGASGLDAQLEAAGVSLRSGEFVVATGGRRAARRGPLRRGLPADRAGRRDRCAGGRAPDGDPPVEAEQAVGEDAGAAARRPHDHGLVAPRSLVPPGARHGRPGDPAPANVEFQRLVAEIRLGRPAEDALEALADRVGSADFRWAVLAVNIQREVGGNLAEILDNVADTLGSAPRCGGRSAC